MNKNIKRLVESLFDDDILYGEDTGNSDLINSKINSVDIVLKPILNEINDDRLTGDLLQCDTMHELSVLSHQKKNGLFISFIHMSDYDGNIELYKKLFDILLECDIHLNIQLLQITLNNQNNYVYTIKELIDFEKYKDIFKVSTFAVTHGKLKSFEGFPSYVYNEIDLNWITELYSLEGFPITDNYLSFYVYNGVLPNDWTGCPHILQQLSFQPNLPSNVNDDIESIKVDIGTLMNIPYDLTFQKNNKGIGCQEYIGSMLVDPDWDNEVKKEIRKYIGNCLKAQYKNITDLKKRLCYSVKLEL